MRAFALPGSRGGLDAFGPAIVLAIGLALRLAIQPQDARPLVRPLATFPSSLAGFEATRELEVPDPERRLLGADDLFHQEYVDATGRALTIYIAYYGQQARGSSIHSPYNCLPGSGWEPVERDRVTTTTVYGETSINRYVIEHGSGGRALVYYWYQGRGRVAANEYRVKVDLLRDAIFRRRTDESLVRVVFPVSASDDLALVDVIAARTIPDIVDTLSGHLPG